MFQDYHKNKYTKYKTSLRIYKSCKPEFIWETQHYPKFYLTATLAIRNQEIQMRACGWFSFHPSSLMRKAVCFTGNSATCIWGRHSALPNQIVLFCWQHLWLIRWRCRMQSSSGQTACLFSGRQMFNSWKWLSANFQSIYLTKQPNPKCRVKSKAEVG